jgi:hypothetical protein
MGEPQPGEPEHVRIEGRRVLCPAEWRDRESLQWSRAFRRMVSWWSEHARAPFGATAGQCGVSILRTHAPKKCLTSHRCEHTARLERSASFGGRASTWFVGGIGDGVRVVGTANEIDGERVRWRERGPVTQVDVRSMYPTILRDERFPVSLSGGFSTSLGTLTLPGGNQDWYVQFSFTGPTSADVLTLTNAEFVLRG